MLTAIAYLFVYPRKLRSYTMNTKPQPYAGWSIVSIHNSFNAGSGINIPILILLFLARPEVLDLMRSLLT